ncbi:guanine nucleotide-binding protein alpha-4 subunit [Amanita rubescens]|nr:guanine nucleotide-binding protein alpha-4 subunit [Amanita rubescens]
MPMLRRQGEFSDDDDPLTKALTPPPNETLDQRDARLKAEKEAQLRSDAIDEEINRQRVAEKKESHCVRVLLLGKSTTLKNFQLISSPKAFKSERASWRAVVQLNVVRSIRLILDAIEEAQQGVTAPDNGTKSVPSPYPTLTQEHLKLRMRLLPLQGVEEALLRKLSHAGSTELEPTQLPSSNHHGQRRKEPAVAFGRLLNVTRTSLSDDSYIDFNDPDDPGVILDACSEDMRALWNDHVIQELLQSMRIRMEDMAGLYVFNIYGLGNGSPLLFSFLDSLERVASLRYMTFYVLDLKTIGVSEHRFTLQTGNIMSHDWRIYDVGAAWASYFDNMDAIIFLAPISCFDQVLVEDPNVNRLEDSILLWKSVVSNALLKDTEIVLFLNKIDIMKAKLRAGIRFGDFVISYGHRSNEFEHAANYLKKKFAALHKQYSPQPRTFYCHLTTVTDVKSTQRILGNVKDMVVRQNLVDSSLV